MVSLVVDDYHPLLYFCSKIMAPQKCLNVFQQGSRSSAIGHSSLDLGCIKIFQKAMMSTKPGMYSDLQINAHPGSSVQQLTIYPDTLHFPPRGHMSTCFLVD